METENPAGYVGSTRSQRFRGKFDATKISVISKWCAFGKGRVAEVSETGLQFLILALCGELPGESFCAGRNSETEDRIGSWVDAQEKQETPFRRGALVARADQRPWLRTKRRSFASWRVT
jgi:hypothetical protein